MKTISYLIEASLVIAAGLTGFGGFMELLTAATVMQQQVAVLFMILSALMLLGAIAISALVKLNDVRDKLCRPVATPPYITKEAKEAAEWKQYQIDHTQWKQENGIVSEEEFAGVPAPSEQ